MKTRARGALNGYYLPNCCAKLPVGAECRSSGPPVICQAHKKRRWGGNLVSRCHAASHGCTANTHHLLQRSVSVVASSQRSPFLCPPLHSCIFSTPRARTDYRAGPCTRQVPAAVKKEGGGGSDKQLFSFLKFCQERRVREESWFKLFCCRQGLCVKGEIKNPARAEKPQFSFDSVHGYRWGGGGRWRGGVWNMCLLF